MYQKFRMDKIDTSHNIFFFLRMILAITLGHLKQCDKIFHMNIWYIDVSITLVP